MLALFKAGLKFSHSDQLVMPTVPALSITLMNEIFSKQFPPPPPKMKPRYRMFSFKGGKHITPFLSLIRSECQKPTQ